MVFSSSYRGGGGTDYACNKIVFYEGTNTPTTTASFGFGVAGGQLDYFSNAAHVFHTGTTGGTSFGTERMRITSTGNVGIGTNNPQAFLDITYSSPSIENKDMLNIKTDSNWGLKIQQAFTQAGNIQYNFIHRYLTVDYNSLTFKGANVGVGTNNPGTKLHVEGTTYLNGAVTFQNAVWHNSPDGYKRLFFDTNSITYISGGNSSMDLVHLRRSSDNISMASLTSSGTFNAVAFNATSDSRIKKDIENINDETALNQLLLIQPTTYNYIDVERNKGFGKVYGFIAQQIREVIPEAVPIIEAIIPNIYKNCLINNKREVYHNIPLDTPIDTEVKIKGSEYKIKEVYEDYFVIDKDIEDVEAFVYGYNINDFHSLNKDYIFTLNVCATQELHRRIEAQSVVIKSQEDRIKDLETKVAILMSNTT